MQDLKKEFPILSSCTYLNTASSGVLSKSLLQWRRKHDEALMQGGSIFRDTHRGHLARIKGTLSEFFNAPDNNLALIPNFSFGFNVLMEGLPKNQKVLLLNHDYPSVNWPVEQRGFEVVYAEIDEHLETSIESAVAKHRPDVFAFSLVQYINGLVMDMEFLRQLKDQYPDMLLVADGTQFLGARQFDFLKSPLDVLGASCYKWLLAGYGNGVFMIKEEMKGRFSPRTIGFNSAEAAYSKRDHVHFIKHFEPGHQDALTYGSLEQSILFLKGIGMDVIEKRNRELSQWVKPQLESLGVLDSEIVNRKDCGTIYNIKGGVALFEALTKEKIIVSKRGKGIRLSFHFYNSKDDLGRLLEVLKRFV